ncbi:hypothetical protein [Mediterraneibacter faecis]|uniref:hypothetical protein n=1 Tax=Mediterraneibacter faecis TaxID=592978 RepID=UPI0018AB439B|nr:hypothetical protein [Mediterraneibacter faecis]MCG4533480.1 hypothetical protein [Mediterraneibacter faecis]
MWIPRWYWENAIRRQDELERRVKRLELIFCRRQKIKLPASRIRKPAKNIKMDI